MAKPLEVVKFVGGPLDGSAVISDRQVVRLVVVADDGRESTYRVAEILEGVPGATASYRTLRCERRPSPIGTPR